MASDLIERLTNPEATEQLIGMVSYEASTWRVEPNRERDAVEEAGFLDAIAHTLEALRTALAIERERAEKAEKEVERCHARLEIDHHFVMSGNDDDDLVRVEIPLEDRQHEIDGIECRDATIKMLDDEVSAMAASLAGARRLLKQIADPMEDFPGPLWTKIGLVKAIQSFQRAARAFLGGQHG